VFSPNQSHFTPNHETLIMSTITDYGHTKAKSLIFVAQNSNPNPKGLVFCRNNCSIMENMDKGLTVPKWVLIVWPKIPQMPQHLSAQFVCPSPKGLDSNEKRLHLASVVRVYYVNERQLLDVFTFFFVSAKCTLYKKRVKLFSEVEFELTDVSRDCLKFFIRSQ
jgi:hypothetical protein